MRGLAEICEPTHDAEYAAVRGMDGIAALLVGMEKEKLRMVHLPEGLVLNRLRWFLYYECADSFVAVATTSR